MKAGDRATFTPGCIIPGEYTVTLNEDLPAGDELVSVTFSEDEFTRYKQAWESMKFLNTKAFERTTVVSSLYLREVNDG